MIGPGCILVGATFLCALAAGFGYGRYHGHPLLGAVAGLGLFVALAGTCRGARRLWRRWQPRLPPCRTGACRHPWDYQYVRSTTDGPVYRCQCGAEYLLQYGTRRFLELTADGSAGPYLIHTRFGRWKPEIPVPPSTP